MLRHLRLDQCDSTQDELKRQLDAYDLISAHQQSAGRGRGANTWEHLPGALAFSFQAPAHPQLTWQSLEVAVSLAQSLEAHFGVSVDVKWPNDLYRAKRKCGGILLNYQAPTMLIGVGLNLYASTGTAWGCVVSDEAPAVRQWKHELPRQLVEEYLQRHPMSTEQIRRDWLARCAHREKTVTITDGAEVITGTFQGIGENGEALVGGRAVYNGTLRWQD